MIRYQLSNRQAKELLVRRRTIHVALPNPPEENLLAWAKASLDLDPAHVVQAAIVDLLVAIPLVDIPGLTGLLGAILDEERPDLLTQRVVACDVTLDPTQTPKGESTELQWPGKALVRDAWIPQMESH